jgi:hypothetical protein
VGKFSGRRTSPALRFVFLIGVVGLFSGMTHEGARSITGPFHGRPGGAVERHRV